MKNILQSKAAGFWVALVLTMGPALVAFLGDAQSNGWVDAGVAGAVILAINSLVKFIQISGEEVKPQMLPMHSGHWRAPQRRSWRCSYQESLCGFRFEL